MRRFFNPETHFAAPPPAPIGKRHVDLPTGYELIAIPPDGQPVIRCANWPECACGDDCHHPPSSPRADWLARGLLLATALIAAGLLIAGLRR